MIIAMDDIDEVLEDVYIPEPGDEEVDYTLQNGTVVKSVYKNKLVFQPRWRINHEIERSHEDERVPGRVKPIKRVVTPDGSVFDFDTFRGRPNRPDLWAELVDRLGLSQMVTSGDIVPVEVAAEGQPAVAAYLAVAYNYSIEDIAEKLDVSADTIRQYLSDFRTQRR
jgi:hypothetical protein